MSWKKNVGSSPAWMVLPLPMDDPTISYIHHTAVVKGSVRYMTHTHTHFL